ncbi:M55 family metallopeptidase [Nonomuraea sp. B19D2]|uniref:M55 family metallopeptidase n=1 Tax=Nonomuraea sp. B19D2 TaxID=3159561 RepID=UPI0032D9B06E
MPARTMADIILDVRINDGSHGEIGINTLLAGPNGVSVVLAGGDDTACEEFGALLPQGPHPVAGSPSRASRRAPACAAASVTRTA